MRGRTFLKIGSAPSSSARGASPRPSATRPSASSAPGRKLGQILVELDYLKGGEIEKYVRIQILDIACAILMSTSTRLVFSDVMEVEAATLSPISIGAVFLTAVQRLPDVKLYRDEVLLEDYVLVQTDGALAIASGMDLSTSEATVLDLVDGDNAVGDIVAASPLEERQDDPHLDSAPSSWRRGPQGAQIAGGAVAGPRPTPSSAASEPFEKELIAIYNDMQCQNHWQVLGCRVTRATNPSTPPMASCFNVSTRNSGSTSPTKVFKRSSLS